MALSVTIGQYSDKGVKELNQDYLGAYIPEESSSLDSKGISLALADGISSSDVSQFASKIAVNGFLEDYYATPETWTVKNAANRVIQATNSWLFSQTQSSPFRHNLDRGYVCTFSTLIFKSNTLHLFHIGDARAYIVKGKQLKQLTDDHRVWVSDNKSYLSRAMGMNQRLEIDYHSRKLECQDIFILATDGVYEFVKDEFMINAINQQPDLNVASELIVKEALSNGSDDNLSIQIARIDSLPLHEVDEINLQVNSLAYPPELRARSNFDGFEIIREIYNSSRSHVYLAKDEDSEQLVVIKTPSIDLRNNADYLERFMMEEWIARRVDNDNLLSAIVINRKRNYLYTVMEYIEGQTLEQWMRDNPSPKIETVRNFIEQIARGLQALHRLEMLHQDIRPANIIMTQSGTLKIIDFGSVHVAGLAENNLTLNNQILGTMQYTAPEYFLGEMATPASDIYSLAVITYQMLSGGELPYGPSVARASSYAEQKKLIYQSVLDAHRTIPIWIDGTLRKGLHINPRQRYYELSEFVYDLRHPNKKFIENNSPPLIERNPLLFWKGLSFILFMIIIFLIIFPEF